MCEKEIEKSTKKDMRDREHNKQVIEEIRRKRKIRKMRDRKRVMVIVLKSLPNSTLDEREIRYENKSASYESAIE